MLTTNIDIADRLINGQMGTVVKIETNQITNKPTKIFITFDDNTAGKNLIDKSNNQFAKEQNAVPIEPILTRIKVRPNKQSSPEIQRMQFPITLAWACTVHKVLHWIGLLLALNSINRELLTMVRCMLQ